MFISFFDLFKIGIGPSSSHTMGPMVAALRFCERLSEFSEPVYVRVTFYGSLAFTGKGHASDKAVILGMLGLHPATLDPEKTEYFVEKIRKEKVIIRDGVPKIYFDPEYDIIFDYGPALNGHSNGMIFAVLNENKKVLLERTYYSTGGGFVYSAEELEDTHDDSENEDECISVQYPFKNAQEMLEMSEESGLSIAQMKAVNEKSQCSAEDLEAGVLKTWAVMNNSIERGLAKEGILPGVLKVKRRAANIKMQLDEEKMKNSQTYHVCNEWLSLYAMAVNEENAAGGQVVTAPTNGAAGVIPAVLRYYLDFIPGAETKDISTFFLTAAAIGSIIKHNASISGAEVGCQGEVGSAAAMAAAGLCAVMGGTSMQIENAAEIALEHHLGMTCDPVAGLVQVPCIERNGLGAVKAVTASALALRGDGSHFVPLDSCIKTMMETGRDMRDIYKETSKGGLAVNVTEC
ncbi:MAG: L-serine ammonia-lyase [Zetaproteobacteria bacterium]|nr:MAG: L-serine ammonia-lyase [Zetaproteobacteria bacterium]